MLESKRKIQPPPTMKNEDENGSFVFRQDSSPNMFQIWCLEQLGLLSDCSAAESGS
jgi:hypothetical protein